MTLTWEALGGLIALVAAVCAVNLFVTRAVIRQEMDKFATHIRPIGECDLLHTLVNRRLDKLEATE
jgi:hypothetical protein